MDNTKRWHCFGHCFQDEQVRKIQILDVVTLFGWCKASLKFRHVGTPSVRGCVQQILLCQVHADRCMHTRDDPIEEE
jgi:hypothetical protein